MRGAALRVVFLDFLTAWARFLAARVDVRRAGRAEAGRLFRAARAVFFAFAFVAVRLEPVFRGARRLLFDLAMTVRFLSRQKEDADNAPLTTCR